MRLKSRLACLLGPKLLANRLPDLRILVEVRSLPGGTDLLALFPSNGTAYLLIVVLCYMAGHEGLFWPSKGLTKA